MLPFVSVLTPTKDRREFIPQLLRLYAAQTWPADRRELVLLDDGRDRVGDLLPADDPHIRYATLDERTPLGTKRNKLCELARGEFIVHMDDDDYYAPHRIERAVAALEASGADVVGKTELAFYDLATRLIHQTPPIGKKHATAGSMAYRRTYWEAHPWAADPHTEERQFLANFAAHLVQLDMPAHEVVLCISHGNNTLPKNPAMPRLPLELEDVIADPELRRFYDDLDLDDW